MSNDLQNWRERTRITVPEAAQILEISRNAAYAAAERGEIPTIKVGRLVLVPVLSFRRMLGEIAEAA